MTRVTNEELKRLSEYDFPESMRDIVNRVLIERKLLLNDNENLTEQVETLDTGLRRKTRDYNELEYRGQFRRDDN